jgi:glycosyltransferase involved in cell wall biosynthesis
VRLGVYADLVYWQDDNGISTSTAFVSWLGKLSTHVDELVVFGRAHPEPGRADHELVGTGVRFVPLPYYESLHRISSVAAATVRSAARWGEELGRCDAVLLFGPHPYAALFGLQARFTHTPVVVGVRQDFPQYLAQRARGWRRLAALPTGHGLEFVHRRLARGGGVVAIGQEMARRYAADDTRVLTTGVSLVRPTDLVPLQDALSRPWPGGHQALVAGRLDPEKNPMLLIEVAKALKRTGPWRLVVAGTGSLAGELAGQVRAQSLQDVVLLAGRLDHQHLFELYRESTVLIHVSLTEGQPQVFYEAAAAGLPIVATQVGGVPAALAYGKRGLLVPPNDADAIAQAVSRLGADPALRAMIVEEAWEWSASETLDAQVARVVSFIEEIVCAAGQRPSRSSARHRLASIIRAIAA